MHWWVLALVFAAAIFFCILCAGLALCIVVIVKTCLSLWRNH